MPENNVYYLIGLDDDLRPIHTMRVSFPPGSNIERGLGEEVKNMLNTGNYTRVIVSQESESGYSDWINLPDNFNLWQEKE